MANLTWDKAIQKVLDPIDGGTHYTRIAELIEEQNHRTKLGATPANTVNMIINKSLKDNADGSPYIRLGKGMYALRKKFDKTSKAENVSEAAEETESSDGVIQCLGMFWKSSNIEWKNNPAIKGQQSPKSDSIDFAAQQGIYLLHDRDKVIYVGRVDEPRLGQRLFEHTKDRLNDRWDRFSWFGLRPVDEKGELKDAVENVDFPILMEALEAILIESLEPPQNRRRGDKLKAVEYIQTPKPLDNNKMMFEFFKKQLKSD